MWFLSKTAFELWKNAKGILKIMNTIHEMFRNFTDYSWRVLLRAEMIQALSSYWLKLYEI